MTTLVPLFILGVIFVVMVLGLRYYTHKTMTERVCAKNPNSEYCIRYHKKKLEKSNPDYKHCEVIFGKTPSGGIKTVICYADESNRIVKKDIEDNASKVLIRELNEKNQPVYETWAPLEEIEKIKAGQKEKIESSQRVEQKAESE